MCLIGSIAQAVAVLLSATCIYKEANVMNGTFWRLSTAATVIVILLAVHLTDSVAY